MKKILALIAIGASALNASAQSLPDAIKLTDREQFEKAASVLKNLIAASPTSGEAWYYLGENYWDNERTDSAEVCYRKGLEVNPKFQLNKVGIGKVLWAAGKKSEAQAQFDAAVSTVCDKANKSTKQEQSQVYRAVAEALVQGNSKDPQKALEFIDKAIGMDPKDAENYIAKGDLLFEANPRDGSAPLENYKMAMDINALNAKPIARKAFMYYRAKNYSASLDEYNNAVSIDPTFAPAYRGRAEANFMSHNYDKATADMNKYLEINTGSTSARVRYAQFLFLVGKYDESLQEINSIRSKGVQNVVLKRIEGYDLCEKGDFATALDRMDEYFAAQTPDKVIALDYEYLGKVHQGIAKATDAGANPQMKIVNGTAVISDKGAQITGSKPDGQGSTEYSIQLTNHDSLAAVNYLKAARMDRTKEALYTDAAKEFSKAKLYALTISSLQEKMKSGAKVETNDYYYLGNAANKAKRWLTADSAWATYMQRNPNAYQGALYRARAQNGIDSTEAKTFAAKPFYEEVVRKMKPEEQDKNKTDLEEAYNYLGLYYWLNKPVKDLPKAKCFFEKVKALNAGTSITKDVTEKYLITKDLKDIAAGNCEVQ